MRRAILSIGVFALSFLAVLLFWRWLDRPSPVRFVLDMTVTGASDGAYGVDLYVNSKVEEPFRTAVHSGRFRYEWPCNVASVSLLRLDPVATRNSEAVIHSFSIESNGVVLKRFEASELAKWDKFEPGEVINGEFRLKSGEQINHIETSNVSIRIPQPAGRTRLLRSVPVGWTQRLSGMILLLGLVAVALGGRFNLALLVLIAAGTVLGFAWTKTINGMPPTPSEAIGWATYAGYGKTRIYYDLAILAIAPFVAAVGVWAIQQKSARVRASLAGDEDLCVPPRGRLTITLAVTVGVTVSIFILAYYVSGASYTAATFSKQPIPPSWDVANQELWAYLYNIGSLPFREFWYPYGGYIAKEASFPWGFLFERVYLSLCMILCFFGFYVVTKSPVRTLVLSLTWFLLSHAIAQLNWIRYTVLVPFVLAYVAASRRRQLSLEHVIFWCCALLALLGDFIVFVYAWLAVAGVLMADLYQNKTSFLSDIRSRFLREFTVPFALILLYCLRITILGQLHGYIEFLLNLGAVSAYTSAPANEDFWLRFVPFETGFFLWGGALLSGVGFYLFLNAASREKAKFLGIFFLGLINITLLYKLLVHPGEVIFSGIPVPVAGFLLLIFFGHERSGRVEKVFVLTAAGLLWGTFYESGSWSTFWSRMGHPAILWADVNSIVHPTADSDQYTAQRWDLNNLRLDQPLLAVMNDIRPQLSTEQCCDLFTLSDEQLLYIMAHKQPPYFSNLYDGSPLSAQKTTVAWLDRNRPSVVVYAVTPGDVFGVFGVPGVVRDPLVFEKITTGYVLEKRIGDYAMLRPRRPLEPVDLVFWGEVLGDIQLSSLPRYSSFARFDRCEGTNCVDFLRVRTVDKGPQSGQVVIGIATADREFHAHMSLSPEQREYYIYLERLWFWGGLKKMGFTPTISDHSPGIDVQIVSRKNREDILY